MDSIRESMLDDDSLEAPKKRGRKAGTSKAAIASSNIDELSNFLALVILALMTSIREEIRPNKEEVDGVSEHLIRIVARHVDIQNKLSGDVLDILGIAAVGTQWYARVAPHLKAAAPVQYQQAESTPMSTMDVAGQYDPGSNRFMDSAYDKGAS